MHRVDALFLKCRAAIRAVRRGTGHAFGLAPARGGDQIKPDRSQACLGIGTLFHINRRRRRRNHPHHLHLRHHHNHHHHSESDSVQ